MSRLFSSVYVELAAAKAGEGDLAAAEVCFRSALAADPGRRWLEDSVGQVASALLERPIGRPSAWLGADTTAALRDALSAAAWTWLQEQIPRVVEQIRVPEMVEQKVLGFSTQRMEEIVRTVTQRELDLIVRLGYVLGGLVGVIAFLISVLLRA